MVLTRVLEIWSCVHGKVTDYTVQMVGVDPEGARLNNNSRPIAYFIRSEQGNRAKDRMTRLSERISDSDLHQQVVRWRKDPKCAVARLDPNEGRQY